MIWMWAGCFGVVPFQNEPPRLVSFNGVEVDERAGFVELDETLIIGEDLPIALEVDDPEGDAVRVWFPESRGWVEFDPDGTEGVWHVPSETVDTLDVVLEDDRDPPARSLVTLQWARATAVGPTR